MLNILAYMKLVTCRRLCPVDCLKTAKPVFLCDSTILLDWERYWRFSILIYNISVIFIRIFDVKFL